MCLDEWGIPTEASNVRDGEDLESYECDLRLLQQLRVFGLLRYPNEAAALRAAPEGFGSLSPVDHVRYWAEAYGPHATEPHFQGHGMVAALLTEYADLLERLAGRPQGVKDV